MFEQKYVYGIYVNVKNYTNKEEIYAIDSRLNHFLNNGLKTTIYYAVDEKGYTLFESKMREMSRNIHNFLGKSSLKHVVKRAHAFGLNSWIQVNPFKVSKRDVEAYTKYLVKDENNNALMESSGEQINYFLSTAYEEVGEIAFRTITEILEDCDADGIILEENFGPSKTISYDFSEESYKNFTKFLEKRYDTSYLSWPQDILEGRRYHSHYMEWKNIRMLEVMEYLRKAIRERFGNIPIAILTQKDLEKFKKTGFDLEYGARKRLFDYLLTNFVNEYNLKEVSTIVRKISNRFKETSILILSVIGYDRKSLSKEYSWDDALKEALTGGSNGIILFDDKNIYDDNAWEKIKMLLQ